MIWWLEFRRVLFRSLAWASCDQFSNQICRRRLCARPQTLNSLTAERHRMPTASADVGAKTCPPLADFSPLMEAHYVDRGAFSLTYEVQLGTMRRELRLRIVLQALGC